MCIRDRLNINAFPRHLLQKLAFVWERGVIIFDNYRGEEHMWIRVGRTTHVEFEHVDPTLIFKSPGKSRSEAKQLFSQAMRIHEPIRGQLSGPGLDTAATLHFRVSDARRTSPSALPFPSGRWQVATNQLVGPPIIPLTTRGAIIGVVATRAAF